MDLASSLALLFLKGIIGMVAFLMVDRLSCYWELR